jgi:hypothetical protein|eukprot:Stramenopile-MAST_4_protein_1392
MSGLSERAATSSSTSALTLLTLAAESSKDIQPRGKRESTNFEPASRTSKARGKNGHRTRIKSETVASIPARANATKKNSVGSLKTIKKRKNFGTSGKPNDYISVEEQRILKRHCEQKRRDGLKKSTSRLTELTRDYLPPHEYPRAPTNIEILKVSMIRLRMHKGLSPLPSHMFLEDSSFKVMPASEVERGCLCTDAGFKIPAEGLPKDKEQRQRMENKQREQRRRRNLKKLEKELEAMTVFPTGRTVTKKEALECIIKRLEEIPRNVAIDQELLKSNNFQNFVLVHKTGTKDSTATESKVSDSTPEEDCSVVLRRGNSVGSNKAVDLDMSKPGPYLCTPVRITTEDDAIITDNIIKRVRLIDAPPPK